MGVDGCQRWSEWVQWLRTSEFPNLFVLIEFPFISSETLFQPRTFGLQTIVEFAHNSDDITFKPVMWCSIGNKKKTLSSKCVKNLWTILGLATNRTVPPHDRRRKTTNSMTSRVRIGLFVIVVRWSPIFYFLFPLSWPCCTSIKVPANPYARNELFCVCEIQCCIYLVF